MQIFHIATHNYNPGDAAVGLGVNALLRQHHEETIIEKQCLMEMENFWGHTRYDQRLVDRMNAADLIVIGGGGMMDGVRGRRHTGFAFDMPNELWRKIKKPVALVALGENRYFGQKYRHADDFINFVTTISQNVPTFCSVRQDGSLQRMSEWFPGAKGLFSEIPDPGIFWRSGLSGDLCAGRSPSRQARQRDVGPRVGIQVAGDNLRRRALGRNGRSVLDPLVSLISRIVSNSRDAEIVLIPHLTRDLDAVCEILSSLDRVDRSLSRMRVEVVGVGHGVTGLSAIYECVESLDVLIAMRGHSQLCSLGGRVPFISYTTHPKNIAFADELGHWHPRSSPKANSNDLLEKVEHALSVSSELVEKQRDYVYAAWQKAESEVGSWMKQL